MDGNDVIRLAVVVAVGYLAGSVPVADVVAQRHRVALRQGGDRNPGYWNAKQLLGRRAAIPVFVGDVAKGAVAAAIGRLVGGPWWIGYVAGAAAMIGHAWPLFARFRGGRSILAFVGAVCVLMPLTAACCAAGCIAVSLASRRFSWGARVGVFGVAIVQAFFEPRAHVAATGALMSIIGLRFAMAAHADRRRTTGQSG